MYLVEIATPGHSGTFGTFQELGIMIGDLIVYFIGGFLSVIYFSIVMIAIVLIAAILLIFVPESPVTIQMNEASNLEKQSEKKHVSIFQKKYAKTLLITAFGLLAQQFCGINVLSTNLSDILASSGLNLNPNLQAGISTSAQFISVFVSSLLVDKFGVKKMWIFSYSFIAIALCVFSLNEHFGFANWAPLVILIVQGVILTTST